MTLSGWHKILSLYVSTTGRHSSVNFKALYTGAALLTLAFFSVNASEIEGLIEERLAEYGAAYPFMEFVRLYRNSTDDLDDLRRRLGDAPVNVDYEHPDNVREDLVELQFYRMGLMLAEGMSSATLFRRNHSEQPYVCVLTVVPEIYNQGELSSTRFMYNLNADQYGRIKAKYILRNEVYVSFLLDHEIFHCLYSYHRGFTYPKTQSEVKSLYDQYTIEMLSDIYALLSHNQRFPYERDFVTSMRYAKVLSLINWDISHYTHGAFSSDFPESVDRSVSNRVEYVLNLGVQTVPAFEQFKRQMVAAYNLVKSNIDPDFALTLEMAVLQEVPLDREIYKQMAEALKDTMDDLFQD